MMLSRWRWTLFSQPGRRLMFSKPADKEPVRGSPLFCWRPRRDLNPYYRRESGMAERNSNKLQGRGRTEWCSRSRQETAYCVPG